jgi:voltage-gated potassium channel
LSRTASQLLGGPGGAPFRRVRHGLIALGIVVVAGTIGYLVLGFGFLDAVYQTFSTVSTVGFSPPHALSGAGKVFTIILILVGVGTALYTFTATLEVLLEGHMRELVRRRRMERNIDDMTGHVIVCGWGRVGREVARFLTTFGSEVVVVDRNADRVASIPHPSVHGDVTEDETLMTAGIARAASLVAALDTDADNLFVTVSARTLRPDLQIIARARSDTSEPKLLRAGADRVVNPQSIGGNRMAAFITQPHVVDFVDVVMHDGSLEFRLEEVTVPRASPLDNGSLRSTRLHDQTGALVLAVRHADGSFTTNPSPTLPIHAGDILISVGTAEQLDTLTRFVVG